MNYSTSTLAVTGKVKVWPSGQAPAEIEAIFALASEKPMADASPNFDGIALSLSNLGTTLIDALVAGPLKNLTDPNTIDLATRATATIAASPALVIGADPVARADAVNAYDSAVAVLLSLASAAFEDDGLAARQAQEQIRGVIAQVIGDAVKIGVTALKVALV